MFIIVLTDYDQKNLVRIHTGTFGFLTCGQHVIKCLIQDVKVADQDSHHVVCLESWIAVNGSHRAGQRLE